MLKLARRLAAVVVVLAFGVGHPAVCAGWGATPEARMACCTDGTCPMHQAEPPDDGSRLVSQEEADSCCAASEQDDSAASAASLGFVTALTALSSPVDFDLTPAHHVPEWWRTVVPAPAPHVPKHLLLSVLIV